MFKTIITLMRGRAFDAEQRLKDDNALALLDQQMRDAAGAVDRARKALALAMAQDRQEGQRLEQTKARIAELKARAVAALQGGREDLAQQAARKIAELEADAASAERARGIFAVEIGRLETHMRKQQARLAELERGRRVARAAQAVRVARRGRIEEAPLCRNTLADAEATLARLREQQAETEEAEAALDGMTEGKDSESLEEAMEREGFGPATGPRAEDVLARLREIAAAVAL